MQVELYILKLGPVIIFKLHKVGAGYFLQYLREIKGIIIFINASSITSVITLHYKQKNIRPSVITLRICFVIQDFFKTSMCYHFISTLILAPTKMVSPLTQSNCSNYVHIQCISRKMLCYYFYLLLCHFQFIMGEHYSNLQGTCMMAKMKAKVNIDHFQKETLQHFKFLRIDSNDKMSEFELWHKIFVSHTLVGLNPLKSLSHIKPCKIVQEQGLKFLKRNSAF